MQRNSHVDGEYLMDHTDSSGGDSRRPSVEVAVTVIRRGSLLLAGFNHAWEAFTLPMTKRRCMERAGDSASFDPERWADAAARNVSEWMEDSALSPPVQLMTIEGYRQSDRDLVVKEYRFEVFTTTVPDGQPLLPDSVAEWLTPAEFRDVHRRPISPTARFLVQTLQNAGKLG